jgi:DNA replication and repair protein RecF
MTGLFLADLSLSHFRSHRRTDLVLDGRPVALFGPNGAGKTNILEAVSLFSPGRGLRRAPPEDISRKPEALGWKLRATLNATGTLHELQTWAEPGQSRTVRINDKTAPQNALSRITRIVWLTPAMDRLWTEGAEGRRRFLDRIVLSFQPDHAETVLSYEKAMRERNRLLRDQQGDSAWYGALEAQMAQSGAVLIANRNAAVARLAKATDGAETTFPAATLELITPDAQPVTLTEPELAAIFAQSRRRDMAAGRSLTGPHRVDLLAVYAAKNTAAAQCSTGEQKALLISLILANARALAQDIGAPPILALDEVAAHLDADRRAALYDELIALGAQAWMTGTGAELFSSLGNRAQLFEISEAAGLSATSERTLS